MKRAALCLLVLVLFPLVGAGCSGKSADEATTLPNTAPINNTAPEAKDAAAAPGAGAGVPTPGGGGLKKAR